MIFTHENERSSCILNIHLVGTIVIFTFVAQISDITFMLQHDDKYHLISRFKGLNIVGKSDLFILTHLECLRRKKC